MCAYVPLFCWQSFLGVCDDPSKRHRPDERFRWPRDCSQRPESRRGSRTHASGRTGYPISAGCPHILGGAGWATSTNAQLSTQLDAFFDFIVTSSLIDMLSEYNTSTTSIGHGRRIASIHVPGSEPGTAGQVTDAQIQTAIQGWITAKTVSCCHLEHAVLCLLAPQRCQYRSKC